MRVQIELNMEGWTAPTDALLRIVNKALQPVLDCETTSADIMYMGSKVGHACIMPSVVEMIANQV